MESIYTYKEPEERTKRRCMIRKDQIPIEELQAMVSNRANERKIQKIIKRDMSFLADVFAKPTDEYICLSEYRIGNGIVDFLVLTSRSRMEVHLIEVKGAEFNTIKSGNYKNTNSHINDAKWQINNHIDYINTNYDDFRKQIYNTKDEVIKGTYKGKYLLGPRGELLVDNEKDIVVEGAVIGGTEKECYIDSRMRNQCEKSTGIHIYSWDSFIRRIDEQHGHYFN